MKSFRIGVLLAAVVCAGALSGARGERGFVEPPRPAWLRDHEPV